MSKRSRSKGEKIYDLQRCVERQRRTEKPVHDVYSSIARRLLRFWFSRQLTLCGDLLNTTTHLLLRLFYPCDRTRDTHIFAYRGQEYFVLARKFDFNIHSECLWSLTARYLPMYRISFILNGMKFTIERVPACRRPDGQREDGHFLIEAVMASVRVYANGLPIRDILAMVSKDFLIT